MFRRHACEAAATPGALDLGVEAGGCYKNTDKPKTKGLSR